jgi:hypothetical protein
VNGPLLCNVATKSAAVTAATKVVWSFRVHCIFNNFLVGYIAAPPTITVFCADVAQILNEK